MRRSTVTTLRSSIVASPLRRPSGDIPFVPLSADPRDLSPAARFAENSSDYKARGEARGLEPRSLADVARTVR